MGSKRVKKTSSAAPARRAVIDIGSNSVRLVVYDGPARTPLAICNEKALCGLGRGITDDGKLNPEAVSNAIATVTRFRRLLEEYGNPQVQTIATAAVREANDGANFVKKVQKLGFDVDVISGTEEAELAALGVVSFEPDATGVAGDLGGGSLELATLKHGKVVQSTSLGIGPLTIARHVGDDLKEAEKLIDKELGTVSFFGKRGQEVFYAVGGAWRALARIHMQVRSYPLSVLHHYEMTFGQAIETCHLVAQQSKRSLEEIPGIPSRRIETLPIAALVLKAVLTRMQAETIIVSAGGIREGLLYRALSKTARREDPFLAACRFYAGRLSPNPAYAAAVANLIEPLFASDTSKAKLRKAAYILMDISAYFHPDLRGRYAFDSAMWAPFVGVSHAERVWLALALYRRYQGRMAPLPIEQVVRLLSWEEQQTAMQFGLAMRFAGAFAPKTGRLLEGCRLEIKGGELLFAAPKDREPLMSDTSRKRLESVAASFDLNVNEKYAD